MKKVGLAAIVILCLGTGPTTIGQSKLELETANQLVESDPDSSFVLAKITYLQSSKKGDAYLQALSGRTLGRILFYQGTFKQASEYLLESSQLFSELNQPHELAETHLWLGAVYQYARQYPLALNYYLEALEANEKLGNQAGKADTYSWIGHYYEKLGSVDTAIHYQHKALELYKGTHQEMVGTANVFDNLGSLYEDLAQYDSAYAYFLRSLDLNRQLDRVNHQIVNLNNLGDVHRKTGNHSKALQLTDSALRRAKQHNLRYQVRSAYRDLSKAYVLLGDHEKAYTYLDSALSLYTKIFSFESAQRIAQLQSAYDKERMEEQITLLQQEKDLNRLLGASLIGALLLVVIAVGILYRIQRNQLKKNREILKQRERLQQTEQDLLLADLKNSMLNEQNLRNELVNRELVERKLREELSLKSQTLTSHTLALIRKNNFLETLREDLKVLKKSNRPETQRSINQLIASINLNFAQEEDWREFQKVFEEIHTDFFENLKLQFPDLSPTDLRLCALLKLNLNSSDISTIMGISQDSLRVARYRLRKKLELDKGSSLVSYLMTH